MQNASSSYATAQVDPVVISGIGLVTPLGSNREATWQRVLAGDGALRPLTVGDLNPSRAGDSSETPWIGAPVAWPDGAIDALSMGLEPVLVMARIVAREAVADARLSPAALQQSDCGCVFGTSKGGLHTLDQNLQAASGEARPWWESWPSNAATQLMQDFGMTGPSLCPVAACATGLVAIIRAAELIQRGDCAVVVAGSADCSLHPLVLASFQRLGVLSRHRPAHAASRPFDRRRSGFVIGAGAGCCVLERASRAHARGAPIYAAFRAGRIGCDPTGITALDESGGTLAPLLRQVIPGDEVPDLIHLHGTATRQNDRTECRAVRMALGSRCEQTACTSVKGALGHLLGAAGSVELALTCLSLRDQIVPPSVNLQDRDDDCDLPFVTGRADRRPLRSALKLSLGFGGHQAAAWLERWPN